MSFNARASVWYKRLPAAMSRTKPHANGSLTVCISNAGGCQYDARRNDLLRAKECSVGDLVHHMLRAADVPQSTYNELARKARSTWPSPWSHAVIDCVERRAVIGTPIAEYVPNTCRRGWSMHANFIFKPAVSYGAVYGSEWQAL
jgi:hypothetical protein